MWPKLEPRREVEDDEVCVEDEEMAPPTAVPALGRSVPQQSRKKSMKRNLEPWQGDEVWGEDDAPPTAVPAQAGKGVCYPQAGTGVPLSGLSRSTFPRLVQRCHPQVGTIVCHSQAGTRVCQPQAGA